MLLQSLTIVFYVCLCSSLVGKLPDTLLFSCLDELFAELRVSDADHELCSLPCGLTLELYCAILSYDEVCAHTRRGNNGSFFKYGSDQGVNVSALGGLR